MATRAEVLVMKNNARYRKARVPGRCELVKLVLGHPVICRSVIYKGDTYLDSGVPRASAPPGAYLGHIPTRRYCFACASEDIV